MVQDISQRDLRNRSREIMDALERGESFTVTRGGRGVGELIPVRPTRAFIPRAELQDLWRGEPVIDAERLRADLDAVADADMDDPFAR